MKNRIRMRILSGVLSISFLCVLATGLSTLVVAQRILRKTVSERNVQITRQAAAMISAYFDDAKSELKIIGDTLERFSADPGTQGRILQGFADDNPKYSCLALIDSTGTIFAATEQAFDYHFNFSTSTRQQLFREPSILEGTRVSGEIVEKFFVSVPLPVDQAAPQAIIGLLNLNQIQSLINDVSAGHRGKAYLVSGNGNVLIHSSADTSFDNGSLPIAQTRMLDLPEDTVRLEKRGRETVVVSQARIGSLGWTLSVEQPVDEAFMPLRNTLINVFCILVIVTAAAYLAGFLLSQTLSEPIRQMVTGTKRIAGGDLDYRIPVTSNDELGSLAQDFNAMVTKLQTRSQELRTSEKNYRLISENSSDIIVTFDMNGLLTYANSRMETITGYAPSEVVGRYISDLPIIGCDEKPGLPFSGRNWEQCLGKDIECEFLSKSGTRQFFEVHFVRIMETDQKDSYLGVIHDVTEKRKIYHQLVQSEKLSSLGELSAGVSHELNNPLTGVLGYAEFLRQGPDTTEAMKADLERIIIEATRAKKIVQNLLVFARQYPPEKVSVNLNAVIQSVLDIRKYETLINNIEVERILDPDLPPAVADPHQMRQVFLNIINNAINAMKGSVREKILTVMSSSDGTNIKLTFHDSGPGIPDENLNRVFDPFFTTMEVGKGTGLGLSISYGIVKEHGGKISAFTRKGEGTQLVIELPADGLNFSPQPKYRETQGRFSVQPAHVLVIENEESLMDLIRRVLSRERCSVDVASTAREALTILKGGSFDAILCDVSPDLGKCDELTTWIESNRPELMDHMVFITGESSEPEVSESFQERRYRTLVKPFTVDELKQAVMSTAAV